MERNIIGVYGLICSSLVYKARIENEIDIMKLYKEFENTIIEGLKEGTIDCIITDHAPHSEEEKNVELAKAPNGIIGFETALPAEIINLVDPGHIDYLNLVRLTSYTPSKLLHIDNERGTLETLLTFPIKSKDIIVGKYLAVTIASILTGIISLVLAIISVAIAQNAFSIYEGLNIMFSPISIVLSVIIIIAYSFFISGLCIAIASSSKTFKEAQSALTPLTFISLFPGMIAFMIGLTGTPLLSIIPFINYTVVFTDASAGNVDWLNIALMLISTIIYIVIVLTYIIKQYKSEKILFSKE